MQIPYLVFYILTQELPLELRDKVAEMEARVWGCVLFVSLAVFLCVSPAAAAAAEEEEGEKVLTLDHLNFSEVVAAHDFIVVEFYAPWCGHCKALAPEYEKAASVLSSLDPPIVLAKIDASEESSRELATEYKIQGFPTIKIFRNGGKDTQDYRGPREADGIVSYLKKQVGPASVEIKSAEDAASLIDDKSVFIVGVFPKFSGEEFENFTALAETLRADYAFGHTLSSKFIPRGESVSEPTLRLLKPFDELVVDSQDFQVDAMEKFIDESTIPILTLWSSDPNGHNYVSKFFNGGIDKAMLFVNFSTDHDAFQSIYKDVAVSYKAKGISFLLGDTDASQGAFQYFGLKPDQSPLLIIQKVNGQKYLNPNVKPDQIESWVKDYTNGLVKPFIKSEPIPEVNDEPVKVVVTASLEDMVFNSGKNVLLEFYAPWCGHCQKLAPILEEVATSFEKDPDVLIAKLDATANDVPNDSFEVQGFPTIYFRSASGNLSQYDGERTKEDIIEFIQKNRDQPAESTSTESQTIKSESTKEASVKDEL